MIRCGSQRNRSARIALSCSSANSRSSYIQSCTSVSPFGLRRQHGDQADHVAREPGPQAGRDAPRCRRASRARPRSGRRPSVHVEAHLLRAAPRRPRCRCQRAPVTSMLAAGDRRDDAPAAGLDVVAVEPVRRAARAAPAPRRESSTCPPPRSATPIARRNRHSSTTCGSRRGVADLGAALRRRGGEQRRLGAGDRRFVEIERRAASARQAPRARGPGSSTRRRRPSRQRLQVRRDRAARRKVAARLRQARRARAREQRAEQQHRAAQLADERGIRACRSSPSRSGRAASTCRRPRPWRRGPISSSTSTSTSRMRGTFVSTHS